MQTLLTVPLAHAILFHLPLGRFAQLSAAQDNFVDLQALSRSCFETLREVRTIFYRGRKKDD